MSRQTAKSHSHPFIQVTSGDIEQLKILATEAPLKRARLCLHHSTDDQIQEMVIALCEETFIPIHRHKARTESFHLIEGLVRIGLFSDEGELENAITLESLTTDRRFPFVYRLCKDMWHWVIPLSPVVVVHEIGCGPFSATGMEAPSWAPAISAKEEWDNLRQKVFNLPSDHSHVFNWP